MDELERTVTEEEPALDPAEDAPETAPEEGSAESPEEAPEEVPADEPAGEAQGEDAPAPAPKKRLGPGNHLSDEELVEELAAILLAAPDPLSLGRLQDLLRRPARTRVREALAALEERFEGASLPFELREVGGGWRLFTAGHQAETVARLGRERRAERVSPAALETLAIVAYRQPVTKAEIEAIRGVQAGPVLRNLVDRGLLRVVGRADQPGAPLQYGTSKEFLDRFGLASLDDLPRDGELVGE